MRYLVGVVVAVGALAFAGPVVAAPSPAVAALQVALRGKGLYAGPVDGIDGPLTRAGLTELHRRAGIACDGKVKPQTRAALGRLGRPLLGQRELGVGAVGWDVASLEFQLRSFGLPLGKVDGRFDAKTLVALRRFQKARGLSSDGIAGPRTFRALASSATPGRAVQPAPAPPLRIHVVRAGESFFSLGQLYRVSPLRIAGENDLKLSSVIVPGQRLRLPAGVGRAPSVTTAASTTATSPSPVAASSDLIRGALDRWSAAYEVDPKLARAVAWMESGFRQDVVSHAGAVGVMQLLPGTWAWIDTLIGRTTPRTYEGNVQAGVRLLRWLLDEFGGNTKLALAGYYQGAKAVRERGLFDDTKQYVAVVLRLYGSV